MCGRVSTSKLCMDKLCCMHVRLNVCMYACKDEWMDGCMDAYIYICMYVFIYLCLYGRSAGTLIFPQAERRHWRYEDGDEVGTWQNNRKLRLS